MHSGGAHMPFADGSVNLLQTTTTPISRHMIETRTLGEIASSDSY
jgi:prepilin-type processing-associated H-X9-DG protein